jgi:hypothetical protein
MKICSFGIANVFWNAEPCTQFAVDTLYKLTVPLWNAVTLCRLKEKSSSIVEGHILANLEWATTYKLTLRHCQSNFSSAKKPIHPQWGATSTNRLLFDYF